MSCLLFKGIDSVRVKCNHIIRHRILCSNTNCFFIVSFAKIFHINSVGVRKYTFGTDDYQQVSWYSCVVVLTKCTMHFGPILG